MSKIIKVIIPQQVKVRVYNVDVDGLKQLLKKHKLKKNITINQIANKLKKPKTMVEHWFRNDDSFSIPDENVWYTLKEILDIHTDDFDESLTSFEIRDGVYDKSNRVYDSNGIAPTLTCATCENERIIVWEN